MSWKFVMRTENKISTIDEAEKLARTVGYEFLLWNGEVWFLHTCGRSKTRITISDLF